MLEDGLAVRPVLHLLLQHDLDQRVQQVPAHALHHGLGTDRQVYVGENGC